MKLSARSENERRGHFYFDPADPIYREHFPGRPVVPGSLIMHAFMQAALESEAAVMPTFENFRFKRFIAPGRYAFEMKSLGDGRQACKLFHQNSVVATGIL